LSKCPLANAEKFLLRRNILSKKDIFRIYSKVNQEIDNSVNFAKNSAFPDESDLERGTYY
jgi:TPP-dependent pyruvate/acetoin dehydrogenase alpha subunit